MPSASSAGSLPASAGAAAAGADALASAGAAAGLADGVKPSTSRAMMRPLGPLPGMSPRVNPFSLSNLGMFGVKTFSSIINPPQGCILSVGAGEKRPWVRDGQLVVADVMTVTLTCDHRVVDGSVGAQWISVFKSLVENPIGLLV